MDRTLAGRIAAPFWWFTGLLFGTLVRTCPHGEGPGCPCLEHGGGRRVREVLVPEAGRFASIPIPEDNPFVDRTSIPYTPMPGAMNNRQLAALAAGLRPHPQTQAEMNRMLQQAPPPNPAERQRLLQNMQGPLGGFGGLFGGLNG